MPISNTNLLPKFFLCFFYWKNPGLSRWAFIYWLRESEGPESREATHSGLNAVQFTKAPKERPHICNISFPWWLPPSLLPCLPLYPPPPLFFQVLILWASAYLCGSFSQTKNEKHNKGKGKVRLEKMQQFSTFLTDDVCNPGSLTVVHRNSSVFLKKSSSTCESSAV